METELLLSSCLDGTLFCMGGIFCGFRVLLRSYHPTLLFICVYGFICIMLVRHRRVFRHLRFVQYVQYTVISRDSKGSVAGAVAPATCGNLEHMASSCVAHYSRFNRNCMIQFL